MKKVVLIGDSIRMCYDKYIKEALADVAEVYYPNENCKFAEYALRFAHEWKNSGKWPDDIDLVHWNVGLWDVLELFGDAPLTSIDYYGEAIARINKRLRMLFPKAKMVFATSTAVYEEGYKGSTWNRSNATIKAYNERAMKALSSTDTRINDLYKITLDCPRSCRSDMTHFDNAEGLALVGGQVLKTICVELEIPLADVHMEKFETEGYSKKEIGY